MVMGRARVLSSSHTAHCYLWLCCPSATPTTRHSQRLLSIRSGSDIEWSEAQKITLSVDLEASTRQLLKFLAVIDRNRALYEGPALDHAIYRYKNFWLPLLAKQSEFTGLSYPLVVPLDCEWIWHIHRLNPTRYKTDCEVLYGRILGNSNVESTIQRTCLNQSKEIWTSLFFGEPFELDLSNPLMESTGASKASSLKSTDYDLVSAVKRQSTFFYQVSRPFMSNDIFLKEAIARYKGFLHLIKRNKKRSIKRFCVPTYDIDLIWHAHQLHPLSYCKDTTAICGEVIEHDDTVSETSENMKLNDAFMETTKQWEEAYDLRYWKAGAMHRGKAPSPLTADVHPLKESLMTDISANKSQNIMQIPKKMLAEVLLEIVEVRGIPQGNGDNILIKISRRHQNNVHIITKKKLSISTETGKKLVVNFQSEPTAELLFELVSTSNTINGRKSTKSICRTAISLVDVVNPGKELSVDGWLELFPPSDTKERKPPTSLRISLSFTPARAPYVLNMVPAGGVKSHTSILDEAGNPVIGIFLRSFDKKPREVMGVLESRKDSILAKEVGDGWSLIDSQWDLRRQYKSGNAYELLGETKVIFIPGKNLDYETTHNGKQDDQNNFTTAVEFSPENPYGKAVALFDLKLGILQIKEDWFLLPGTISAYCILYEVY